MAKKGRAKNTRNKKLHTKLLKRKKNKVRDAKISTKERLKDIIKKHQEQSEN
ncbi:hypothetical protein [Lutibacter sp.]|uniref:hypothetical protein n=1 Tax=Lutibacter sp. TaxID=1925666 RepID=UPI002737132C|nr:hypothetical protein [Lutibacter sp.]MDP3311794.1 hypothetical protein [Lutibacter sp.]